MFGNTIVMALLSIRRNLTRSTLTMLGIVIGVGSVMALVTIGEGASAQVANEIGALGHNLLTIRPGADHRPGGPRMEAEGFELADAKAIIAEVDGLDHVAPSSSSQSTAIYGNVNWPTRIIGTTEAYTDCRGYDMDRGRNFTEEEGKSSNSLCILGATVTEELFQKRDPVGQRIRIENVSCKIIGTLVSKGESAMGGDQDDMILMPLRAFQRRISGDDNISSIEASVSENRSSTVVKNELASLLRERRKTVIGKEDDFHVRDMAEIVATAQQTSSVLTVLLSAIAAVSLLVGGIGIMNIMLVSVTERTREIGIRLAVGATSSEVMSQFLVEGATLSGVGGFIGLLLGLLGAYVATQVMNLPFAPSPAIAIIAVAFSIVVGITFGFLPARRAARLNPMEALRYE